MAHAAKYVVLTTGHSFHAATRLGRKRHFFNGGA